MAMNGRRIIGKLLLVGAGGGFVVLLMFVFEPWLTQLQAPQEPPTLEEVAPESTVMEGPALPMPVGAANEVADREGEPDERATAVRSPLVGLRDNGEEVAVVLPAANGESSAGEAIADGDDLADGEQPEELVGLAENLPPVLSPEDVAAMALLHDRSEESGGPGSAGATPPGPPEQAGAGGADMGQPEVIFHRDTGGGHQVEAPHPPPSSTRDVQELLQALGYEPGPVDGIWGSLTAGAWRNFARDAVELAARAELETSQPERAAEPPAAESPATSGETVAPGGSGTGQAGSPHPGLPPQEAARPVVVPATLRGVMGYRMPLVSRQGVPDQVVSGVLIPAHTTFVILKPGHWELVGLELGEVERLRDAARRESEPGVVPTRRGWNPLRLFRRQAPILVNE